MKITFIIPLWGYEGTPKTEGSMSIYLTDQGKVLMHIHQDHEEGDDELHFELRPVDLRSIMHALKTCQIQAHNEGLEQPRGHRDPRFEGE